MLKMQSMTLEEQLAEGDADADQFDKDIQAAQARKSWLASRDSYKQERLARIQKLKEKKNGPDAPTLDELGARPTLK